MIVPLTPFVAVQIMLCRCVYSSSMHCADWQAGSSSLVAMTDRHKGPVNMSRGQEVGSVSMNRREEEPMNFRLLLGVRPVLMIDSLGEEPMPLSNKGREAIVHERQTRGVACSSKWTSAVCILSVRAINGPSPPKCWHLACRHANISSEVLTRQSNWLTLMGL